MGTSSEEPSAASKAPATWFRNILVVCGIYYLSVWLAYLLGLALDPVVNRFANVYSENVLTALYMGIVVWWDRTVAAIIAGAAVTLIVHGHRSWLWALVIAPLYAIDYGVHDHWVVPPAAWDRLWVRIGHFSPVVACIVAAFITAYFRRRAKSATVRRAG
jgi:hypothetical protein